MIQDRYADMVVSDICWYKTGNGGFRQIWWYKTGKGGIGYGWNKSQNIVV